MYLHSKCKYITSKALTENAAMKALCKPKAIRLKAFCDKYTPHKLSILEKVQIRRINSIYQ